MFSYFGKVEGNFLEDFPENIPGIFPLGEFPSPTRGGTIGGGALLGLGNRSLGLGQGGGGTIGGGTVGGRGVQLGRLPSAQCVRIAILMPLLCQNVPNLP